MKKINKSEGSASARTLENLKEIEPRLKVGVLVLNTGHGLYIGGINYGIESDLPHARAILNAMDGQSTCAQISQNSGAGLDDVLEIVRALDNAGLVDTVRTSIRVQRFHSPNPNRSTHKSDDSNDGGFQQLQSKLAPELSASTWISGVRDGGVNVIAQRRNWEVSIFGEGRIATLLYGILLASGVSETLLIPAKNSTAISAESLTSGFLRQSDIGLNLKVRSSELAGELSLFPANSSDAREKFAISIGQPQADQQQEWMSSGTPHLVIEPAECASLFIGPLVIPGITPCLRCVRLIRHEREILWDEIELNRLTHAPSEVPVSVAHYVAGLITLELLSYIDREKSQLLGACLTIDFHNLATTERTLYTRHLACGCNWGQEKSPR